ncbi:MAG: PIN domain nuclease [Thermoanaerobaculia bacterium]|nr:PIN domain nuclease [Thermoanaerobaculia bacterium]
MILVDTSVWVDFFRGSDRAAALAGHLESNLVLLHPWVLGELALGGLGPRREAVIADLKRLPAAPLVSDDEVLELILARRLSGRGVGWVDVHLLAAALVARCGLWTFDGRLGGVTRELGVATDPELQVQ